MVARPNAERDHEACEEEPRFACVRCHRRHVAQAHEAGMEFEEWVAARRGDK